MSDYAVYKCFELVIDPPGESLDVFVFLFTRSKTQFDKHTAGCSFGWISSEHSRQRFVLARSATVISALTDGCFLFY